MLERCREGSRPGRRRDPHLVCLAIEGGGMRAAVTAGMCVVLEAAGLMPAFDRIYGVSAGALNAWAASAGRAALAAQHYRDAVVESVVSGRGALRGRPLIDLDLLFDELIPMRSPIASGSVRGGPDLRILATSLETMSLRVLHDFTSAAETRSAVRASASLPRLAGDPPIFRGERMADGSLIEPIPLQTPLREGATHVLVLRSRGAEARRTVLSEAGERLAWARDPALQALLRGRRSRYNAQAAALQRGETPPGAEVQQVTVAADAHLGSTLRANVARISRAVDLGAEAMARSVLAAPVEVCWQPVVYGARPLAPLLTMPPRAGEQEVDGREAG